MSLRMQSLNNIWIEQASAPGNYRIASRIFLFNHWVGSRMNFVDLNVTILPWSHLTVVYITWWLGRLFLGLISWGYLSYRTLHRHVSLSFWIKLLGRIKQWVCIGIQCASTLLYQIYELRDISLGDNMLTRLEFYFFETPANFLLNDNIVLCYLRYFFANQLKNGWVNIENSPKLLLTQIKYLRVWIHRDGINGVENSLLDKTKISKSLTFLQTLLQSRLFVIEHVLHDFISLVLLYFVFDDCW